MKQTKISIFKILRCLALAGTCLSGIAHADDYGDVNQLLQDSKFNEAMTRIDSYLVGKPADPQMRFLKGVLLRNLNKPDEAVAIFIKLTEDYPELPEPYNNLAVLYAGQGLYDKARAALEMAVRSNPNYATAHENLGDIYARLASQAYDKALQLDPDNTALLPKITVLRKMLKTGPDNPRQPASAAAK